MKVKSGNEIQGLDDVKSPHQQFQSTPNSNNTSSNNMLGSRENRVNQINNESLAANNHTYRSENAKNTADGNLSVNKNKI